MCLHIVTVKAMPCCHANTHTIITKHIRFDDWLFVQLLAQTKIECYMRATGEAVEPASLSLSLHLPLYIYMIISKKKILNIFFVKRQRNELWSIIIVGL